MLPLIKWPGGKSKEINYINSHIPSFDRYIEPFFGGGALGFQLEPTNAIVNDIDPLLMQFYLDIKTQNPIFLKMCEEIIHDWYHIDYLATHILSEFNLKIFEAPNSYSKQSIENIFLHIISKNKNFINSHLAKFKFLNYEYYYSMLLKFTPKKIKRIASLYNKNNDFFNKYSFEEHFLSCIKSTFYHTLRDYYFNVNPNSATFFFIREMCYGSMFRYNSKGKFNIPYGGISYNTKNLEHKLNQFQSNKIKNVIHNFKFMNNDFLDFLKKLKPTKNDFIFLDPPYDLVFKNYSNFNFDENDHIRLSNYLKNCKAKWLMIINSSPFIMDLYKNVHHDNRSIIIQNYDTRYSYNIRGRNQRNTNHLLIKNY